MEILARILAKILHFIITAELSANSIFGSGSVDHHLSPIALARSADESCIKKGNARELWLQHGLQIIRRVVGQERLTTAICVHHVELSATVRPD